MKPTEKSAAVDKFIEDVTGVNRKETIEDNRCVMPSCRTIILPPNNEYPFGSFTDELSITEYRISGLCQACQDSVFNGPQKGEE